MMSELFDEQAQREAYDEAIKKQMKAQGRAEGRAEGIEIGEKRKVLDVAFNLLALGTVSKEDIAKATGLTIEKIKELAVQNKLTPA